MWYNSRFFLERYDADGYWLGNNHAYLGNEWRVSVPGSGTYYLAVRNTGAVRLYRLSYSAIMGNRRISIGHAPGSLPWVILTDDDPQVGVSDQATGDTNFNNPSLGADYLLAPLGGDG